MKKEVFIIICGIWLFLLPPSVFAGKVADTDSNMDADTLLCRRDSFFRESLLLYFRFDRSLIDSSYMDISNSAVNLFNSDNDYLFFIPIDGTTGTGAANDVVAEITYDIVTAPSADATTAVASSLTKEVDLGTNVFAQGKAYKFTFTITLNAITVDVDDFDWDTETNKPVTVN